MLIIPHPALKAENKAQLIAKMFPFVLMFIFLINSIVYRVEYS